MKIKTLILERTNINNAIWFSALMVVSLIIPHYIHNQFITGPIVNASLFLAAFMLGSGGAILIGLVPSVVALSSGLLPVVLAPVVPFIMIGNAILIVVFNNLRKFNTVFASIIAAIAKYLFLYLSVYWISNLITQKSAALKAASMMMQWPQLLTALMGAAIALILLKIFRKI